MYPKQVVFVYGTLKRGFSNHFFLKDAKFLGRGRTLEPYALSDGEYPFVYRKEKVSPVCGEIYEMDGETLLQLDHLEQDPEYYCRDQLDVVLEDGDKLRAWLYFFPVPQGRLIESGEWGVYNLES
ncbi:MAG: gamma-glutamylcyclotransferase [Proteobacteria bacterium]|nr:gamma-glutamylcyclotransferase [Pseudomonadota bacterium]MBU1612662.1 gamma-glutamylcyclotransferase [Pseudomonadota bacterium]